MFTNSLRVRGLIKMARTASKADNPITDANRNSQYVFSPTSNTTIGSVAIVKKTAKDPNGNIWVSPDYNPATQTLTFNGTTQSVAYAMNTGLHVAPLPFSLQLDINPTKITGPSYVVNIGQGYGLGYPELILGMSDASLYVSFNGANAATPTASYSLGTVTAGTWYRVGIMFYVTGGKNYLRIYVNNIVKIQTSIAFLPWASTAGIAFGNDNANYPGFYFGGQMRNIFMDKKLFWTV